MRSEHLAQGGVHQVSRCVISTRRIAFLNVNMSKDGLANFQLPRSIFTLMNNQALRGRKRIQHRCEHIGSR
jgi:hypothetical protein